MKKTAIKAALEAGKILKKGFRNYKTLTFKQNDPCNYLTEVDLESQKKIIQIIKNNYPKHKIISEEKKKEENKIQDKNDYYWIIDPLDGTSSFVHGNVYFSVSIALYKNNNPIIGIVYFPIIDELFTAEKGKGSYFNNTKLKSSNIKSIKDSFLGMTWNSSDQYFKNVGLKIFYDFGLITRKNYKQGSATANLIGVTNKKFDIAIGCGPYIWDIAAIDLIVREAGGQFTTLDNKKIDLDYEPQIVIASTNKTLHQKVINKIKRTRVD